MSETATPAQDTKRRLAPQVSFKPDPSYENGKKNSDGPRKSVIRFTREVLIAKRKPSSLMACMAVLTDVVSEEPSDPVCFETLEPEDVIRIWNAAKANHDASRGRGRSRVNRDNDDDLNTRGNDTKDLWDAEDTSAFDGKPFDFSKVAEESEKFRSELDNMKKSKHALNEDPHKMEEIDMDSLLIGGDSGKSNVENKQEKETPAVSDSGKMTKIEFGSLLTSANQSNVNSNATFSLQGYDATFVSSNKDTGSSLLSKIGVNLETPAPAPVAATFVAPEPPKRTAKWFYRDPSNQIQGPFQQSSMYQWNKEGYFSPDLPIQAAGWSKFYPFIEIFPKSATAFEHVPDEPLPILPGLNSFAALNNAPPASNTGNSSGTVNNNQVSVAKETSAPVTNKQNVKAVEAPKQQPPQQQQQQQAKTDVDRSNIAKKLLGLSSYANSSSQQSVAASPSTAPVEEKTQQTKKFEQNKKNQRTDRDDHKPQQQAAKVTNEAANSGDVSPKPSKGWNKDEVRGKAVPAAATNLLSIQEEQRVAAQQQTNSTTNNSNVGSGSAAPTGVASLQLKSFLGINASKALGINSNSGPKGWSSSGSNTSKSLQEIMSEEMSQKQAEISQIQAQGAAQVQQQHQQHLAQQALARQQQMQSHSWASKAARPTPNAPPAAVAVPVPTILSRNTPVAAAPTTAPVAAAKASPVRTNNTASAKSNFGGKAMSAEMSEWCVSQLKKMNYSEQLSDVLDFCMSLKSPVEIRETLSTYLGSSPQVTNFATDFIRYKEEGRRPSGESGSADIKRAASYGQNAGGVQNKKKIAK